MTVYTGIFFSKKTPKMQKTLKCFETLIWNANENYFFFKSFNRKKIAINKIFFELLSVILKTWKS